MNIVNLALVSTALAATLTAVGCAAPEGDDAPPQSEAAYTSCVRKEIGPQYACAFVTKNNAWRGVVAIGRSACQASATTGPGSAVIGLTYVGPGANNASLSLRPKLNGDFDAFERGGTLHLQDFIGIADGDALGPNGTLDVKKDTNGGVSVSGRVVSHDTFDVFPSPSLAVAELPAEKISCTVRAPRP